MAQVDKPAETIPPNLDEAATLALMSTRTAPAKPKSNLQLLAPTQERFVLAASSDEPIFPPTRAERAVLTTMKTEAHDFFRLNNFAEANRVGAMAKAMETDLHLKETSFRNVRDCEADARACMQMELRNMEFIKAGKWKLLQEKLAARLEDHKKEKKKAASQATASKKSKAAVGDGDSKEKRGAKKRKAFSVADAAAGEASGGDGAVAAGEGTGDSAGEGGEEKRPGKGVTKRALARKKELTMTTFTEKLTKPYTWEGCEYDNYLGHSFFFQDGGSYCESCGVRVDFYAWSQHIHGRGKTETEHTRKLAVGMAARGEGIAAATAAAREAPTAAATVPPAASPEAMAPSPHTSALPSEPKATGQPEQEEPPTTEI